jgi:hypothetical protein
METLSWLGWSMNVSRVFLSLGKDFVNARR